MARVRLLISILAVALASRPTEAQQAVSAINQARLFTVPAANYSDADATAAASDFSPNDDDSFGTQLILKNQERPRPFALFGDVSTFYTTNVDLTPNHTRSDAFVIANFGAAWRQNLMRSLTADFSLGGSLYRYDRASALDFDRLGGGAGISWMVPHGRGVVAYARYDFTELWNRHGSELLRDHTFTLGAQRTFSFGRPQLLTFGMAGIGGISTPRAQQREQATIFSAYHLQLTRLVGADLVYRYAAQFYTEDDRLDHNQTLSFVIGFSPQAWLRMDGSISAGWNNSNRDAFDYSVTNLGGALRLSAKF